MPYIDHERRNLVDKPLEDLIEWVKWNVYLMETRDETLYHVVVRLLRSFYSSHMTLDYSIIPPVDPDRRNLVDQKLMPLMETIMANSFLMEKKDGVLNYTICRIINGLYPREVSKYADYNSTIGVL